MAAQPTSLGAFSVSFAVANIEASRAFYEKLGCGVVAGDAAQNWQSVRLPMGHARRPRESHAPGCLDASAATQLPPRPTSGAPMAETTYLRHQSSRGAKVGCLGGSAFHA